MRGNWEPSAKNDFSQENQQQQEDGNFHRLLPVPFALRRGHAPKHKQWSHDQNARSIAQPPSQPNWPVVGPLCETANRQTANPKRGSERCADDRSEREFKNILRSIKDLHSASKLIDQPRATECFQS